MVVAIWIKVKVEMDQQKQKVKTRQPKSKVELGCRIDGPYGYAQTESQYGSTPINSIDWSARVEGRDMFA